MVRDDEHKIFSPSEAISFIQDLCLFVLLFFFLFLWTLFKKYICMYMRFVLLNCDLNILLFSFCFFINYPHKK